MLVLTGAGKAFSAGGDIEHMQNVIDEPHLFLDGLRNGKKLLFGMLDCPKPIIAKVNGAAMGLGATIALFSDHHHRGQPRARSPIRTSRWVTRPATAAR